MLEESALKNILADWSYWDRPIPVNIPRKVLQGSLPLESDLVLVIQGVRRCGKSTLLAQIVQEKGLNPHDCYFINFEDPRLSHCLNYELLQQIVEFASARSKGRCYFFFDEIQNVENWEKWLHTQLELSRDNVFIVTGSNSSLLSGDLATALTGRHITRELYPFDYPEFCLAKPEASFEDFLLLGGFPRAMTYPQPGELLREYFTDIIERDVRRHVSVRSSLTLVQLITSVFESLSAETSQRKLASVLGIAADTAGVYLNAAQNAYILLGCPFFALSERKRSVRNCKYYPVDLGLRNSVVAKLSHDAGKGLETVVFHYLCRKKGDTFFWAKNGEVDFVHVDGSRITPYQVSWDGMKPRHETALKEFYEVYPSAEKAIVVSRDNIEELLVGKEE